MLMKQRNKSPVPAIIFSACILLGFVTVAVVTSSARKVGEDAQAVNDKVAAERRQNLVIQGKAIEDVDHRKAMESIGVAVPTGSIELSKYPVHKKLTSEEVSKYTLTPNPRGVLNLTTRGVIIGYLHPDGRVYAADGKTRVPYTKP